MFFSNISQILNKDKKMTIGEMTSMLNTKNIKIPHNGHSFAAYVQGDKDTIYGDYLVGSSVNPTKIRDYCFYRSPITSIGIRIDLYASIGVSAFEGCENVHEFYLSYSGTTGGNVKTLKEIGDRAFFGVGSKTKMSINFDLIEGSKLERIGVSAFEGMGGDKGSPSVMYVGGYNNNNPLSRIESRAFANSNLRYFVLGYVSDYIAPDIFASCTNLETVRVIFPQSSSAATNFPWGADTKITKFVWQG